MAFDPDAFLGRGAPGGFDPDAFIGRGATAAPAPHGWDTPEPEEPSLLSSVGRGVKQGVTLGFGDEITGALESAFTNKTYRQARDEARANDKAARAAHPIAFGAGEIAGGVGGALATGGLGGALGAAGIGARIGTGIAGSIVRGAGAGIAQGIGDSEAEDVAGIAKDAGRGGLIGGATGAVAHGLGRILGGGEAGLVRGAPARADQALAGDLLEKVPARTQDKALSKLGGREGLAETIRGDKVLEAAKAKGPEEFADQLDKRLDHVGQQIGGAFKKVAGADAEGMPLPEILKPLRALKGAAEAAGDPARAGAIDREINGLERLWGDRGAVKLDLAEGGGPLAVEKTAYVPITDVHQVVKRYGRGGFQGGDFANPSEARQLGRDMNSAVRDAMHEHMEKVIAASPDSGASMAKLRALNNEYSRLSALGELADAQATRAARNAPTLGDRISSGVKLASTAASLATHNPIPHLATHYGPAAAAATSRAATKMLARVAQSARAGNVPAKLVQEAIEAGVPRGTVEATVSAFSPRSEAEPSPEAF